MRIMKQSLAPALMACALSVSTAPIAGAQEFENRTIVSFDNPVQVPGAVLPAGRYVFQLVNPELPRRSVEIRKEDGGPALVTPVVIPAQRLETESADGVKVTFVGTGGSQPPAIKAWFYPGEETGHVFVYPEKQARQIAEATRQFVLASSDADASGAIFLIDQGGAHQPYSGGAQQAYLAESGESRGEMGERAAASGSAADHLDRMSETVRRMLASPEQREAIGTAGSDETASRSPGDQVTISREDLLAIQQYIEHLRRDLAASQPKSK